jgi:hypothetical protein
VQLFSNNGCLYGSAIPVTAISPYLLSLIYGGGILFLIRDIAKYNSLGNCLKVDGMIMILFGLISFFVVIYKGGNIRSDLFNALCFL